MNVSRPAQSVRWSSLSAHRSALGDQLTLSERDSACAERILARIERMLTCTVAWDGERSSSALLATTRHGRSSRQHARYGSKPKGSCCRRSLGHLTTAGFWCGIGRSACWRTGTGGRGFCRPLAFPSQLVLSPGPPVACVALAALSCVTVAVAVFSAYDDFFRSLVRLRGRPPRCGGAEGRGGAPQRAHPERERAEWKRLSSVSSR